MREWLYLLMIALLFGACSGSETASIPEKKPYLPVALKHAKNFTLLMSGNHFQLTLLDPASKKELKTVEFSTSENNRIMCLTATLTGMFCELNERTKLIGVTAENQLFDSALKKRFRQGKLKEFGDFTQLSVEQIVATNPDIILYNYVTQPFPNQEKLERLGIDVLVVNDWLESHPLAKAEWIKVVGALTGKFEEACALFDKIEKRYFEIVKEMEHQPNKPSVISGNLIGGTWYTPSGENYFGILIKDAGGDYRYKESKGSQSLALSLEKVLKDNKTTDIWLNPGVPNWQQLERMNPRADLFEASEKGIYCYSGQLNKFWEQSAARPDYLLSDLSHIFHPRGTTYQFHYYAPLTK